MIDTGIRNILKDTLRKNYLTEYKEITALISEVEEDIKNYANNEALTDKDREFIKKFPDLVRFQPKLIINSFFIPQILGNGFCRSSLINTYSAGVYGISTLMNFPDTPRLVTSMSDFSESFPELVKKIQPKVRKCYDLFVTYIEKVNYINKILDSSEITVAELKKYSPKLWEIYEKAKN